MLTEGLSEVFANNPYFSAGAGLIGLGTGLAILKQGILRYSQLVKRQFLVSLEIPSRDKSYQWMLYWLTHKTNTRRHHSSVQTWHQLHDNGSSSTHFNFVPSPGIHYMRWKSIWFKVERHREKAGLEVAAGGSPFESMTLTAIGRNPNIFIDILEEAKSLALRRQEGKTVLYTSWANEWRPFGQPQRKRPLSSVILDQGISESILHDVHEFNQNGKWYYDRGIPYRRGYLLYGPPGTGKSSFVKALAAELNYNICLIHLNEGSMTDDRLNHLLNVIPERSLLLLEDIDATFIDRVSTSQSRVTFSGLLNALDGVGSSEERIIFMTTNHYDRLDAALLRPGRVDVQKFIGLATPFQMRAMFQQFYPDASPQAAELFVDKLAKASSPPSPAKIQGHFILYKNDPAAAIQQAHLIL